MRTLVVVGITGIAVLAGTALLAIYLLTEPGPSRAARRPPEAAAPAAPAQPPQFTLPRPGAASPTAAAPAPGAAPAEPVAPVAPPVIAPPAPTAPGADGSWVDRAATMPGWNPHDRLGGPRPGPAWDPEDEVRPPPPPPRPGGRFSRHVRPPAQ